MKHFNFWILPALALATLGTVGCPRRPREEQFRYRLGGLDKTDPSMIVGREVSRIRLEVPRPRGIALDNADRLYVAGSNRVDVMSLSGEILRSHPWPGAATCVYVDDRGTLFTGLKTHVSVAAPGDDTVNEWAPYNEKSHITSIAASDDYVFVADAGNRVVLCYDHGGQLQSRLGARDPARGIPGFIIPSPCFDLAVEREDSLWVTNPGRLLLANYHPDGTRRTAWGKASMKPDGFCGCCNPTHFALLPDGSFVTSEKGLVRIKHYTADGSFAGIIAGPEQFAEGVEIGDLAVDSKGRVLMLEPRASEIRVYALYEATKSR